MASAIVDVAATHEKISTILLVKFGLVKTRALHISSLSCSKYWVASIVQKNASFLVHEVRCVDIIA